MAADPEVRDAVDVDEANHRIAFIAHPAVHQPMNKPTMRDWPRT